MFGRNRILFLSAGLFVALTACHQAKPASTLPAQSAEVEQTDERAVDPSARSLLGAAPDARQPPSRRATPAPVAPRAQPPAAKAPGEITDPNDPMRLFDMP